MIDGGVGKITKAATSPTRAFSNNLSLLLDTNPLNFILLLYAFTLRCLNTATSIRQRKLADLPFELLHLVFVRISEVDGDRVAKELIDLFEGESFRLHLESAHGVCKMEKRRTSG